MTVSEQRTDDSTYLGIAVPSVLARRLDICAGLEEGDRQRTSIFAAVREQKRSLTLIKSPVPVRIVTKTSGFLSMAYRRGKAEQAPLMNSESKCEPQRSA